MSESPESDVVKLPPYRSSESTERDELETAVWKELEAFLNHHEDGFENAASGTGDRDGSELGPPKHSGFDEPPEDEFSFSPEGWVGRYTDEIRVTQNRVSDADFQAMEAAVAKWVETVGPATASSILKFLPDVLESTVTRYRSYSQQLIEQTESVLAGRPPVKTTFTREKGPTARGKPLPAQTARHRATGQNGTVTQRVEFSIDTPFNALLIRFHMELAGQLAQLQTAVSGSPLETELHQRKSYHREYIAKQFPETVTETALETDFKQPDTVASIRESAPRESQATIDLWEAYLFETPLAVDISNQLDTAVKPAEKIYELYVLRALITTIEDAVGGGAHYSSDGLEGEISFGDAAQVTLLYDSPAKGYSQLLIPGFSESPGRPDFLLLYQGVPIWVGDAKFKSESSLREFRGGRDGSNAGLDDGERFIRYLIDLIDPQSDGSATGTIIAPNVAPDSVHSQGGVYEVEFTPLSPNSSESGLEMLQETIENAIPDSN